MGLYNPLPAAGGGGAASSYSGSSDVTQGEVDAGSKTVAIGATLPHASYIPICYIVDSNGQKLEPVVQLPPLTDGRTTSTFVVDPPDVGTLYWSITIG